jgi:hypothetical protein
MPSFHAIKKLSRDASVLLKGKWKKWRVIRLVGEFYLLYTREELRFATANVKLRS